MAQLYRQLGQGTAEGHVDCRFKVEFLCLRANSPAQGVCRPPAPQVSVQLQNRANVTCSKAGASTGDLHGASVKFESLHHFMWCYCTQKPDWFETSSQLYGEKPMFRIIVCDQQLARSSPEQKPQCFTVSHELKTEQKTQTQMAFCRGLLLISGSARA